MLENMVYTFTTQMDTTVLHPVISPEAEDGQIHLNVVDSLLI